MQSFVRNGEQREVLNDLDLARQDVLERQGKSHAYDLISKTMVNLIRRWGDG